MSHAHVGGMCDGTTYGHKDGMGGGTAHRNMAGVAALAMGTWPA